MNQSTNTSDKAPSLVIVGNGMVAGRFLDELLARSNKHFNITVIGAEPHGSYNRIMLSSVLAKDSDIPSIVQKDPSWYENNGIEFIANSSVTQINRAEKCVITDDGKRIEYDELVLATGSNAVKIPFPNADLENILTFRTIADTLAMLNVAEKAKGALVIGGGLLGLEAAYGLAKAGLKITLVQKGGWLLNRQLDECAGKMLSSVMSAMNIDFVLDDDVKAFNGAHAVESVSFASGRVIDIQLAVIAVGVRPNAMLGLQSGLEGERAIKVDDYMQSSDPHISAIGECIEHEGHTFGMVDPLWRQAQSLAERLINNRCVPFKNQAIATKLKVSGVQVFSAGEVETQAHHRAIIVSDKKANIYRKLLIENNHIVGIVLFGDVRSGPYYFELMEGKKNVQSQLPSLIFGEAFQSESAASA